MRTMRAVYAEELDKNFCIREVLVPVPNRKQALVRIHASGVCPTDTSISSGSWLMKRPMFPYIPGHEGAGVIAAVGSDVSNIKEGDRVGVFWLNSTCHSCPYCLRGRENLCLSQESTGYTMNGTHAEYCLVSADFVVPLPTGGLEQLAPLMCAGVTSYKAVKELGADRGDIVVVIGVGGTGHLAIQYAVARGLTVLAVDVDQSKLELATSLGASLAVNANGFQVNKIVRETGGVHGVIVTAPMPKAFEHGLRMLRRGGVCVLVGVSEAPLAISAFPTVINEYSIRGTVSGTRADLVEALDLVNEGKVRTVVSTTPMEEVNIAIREVKSGQIVGRKVLTM
ncbi:MAG: Alcohol dehydrogenase (EC [Candidatus Burkholderia crenata]|nr:MAG: Alcohol dehydrogenase (EC [Candidatus Burkholderia crenata]